MKKVFLYSYDKQNLGDDLFVRTIVRRYSNVRFYIWTDKNNISTYSDLNNLKVIRNDSQMIKLLDQIRPGLVIRYKAWKEKKCSAVVYIGGSIFMEYENWKAILNWWDYEASNRSLYILGANFGPYRTEEYRDRMANVFQKAQDLCFRDRYSFDLFSDVSHTRYAPDILFSYPQLPKRTSKKQLFVSVINCTRRSEGQVELSDFDMYYTSQMANLLNSYLADGYKIVLSAFCMSEGDADVQERILSKMHVLSSDEQIQILNYNGVNEKEIVEEISVSEYVIATRFHAVILALTQGKAVFPIVYSDKTIHMLNDIGFCGTFADLRDMSQISYEFSRRNLEEPVEINIKQLAKDAEGHFLKLDRLLRD